LEEGISVLERVMLDLAEFEEDEVRGRKERAR
jgi:hypothetical protein